MAYAAKKLDEEQRFASARDGILHQPRDAGMHLRMGEAYTRAGQLSEAVVELRRALRMNPKNAEARRLLASALRSMGRNTEATAYGVKA